METPASSPRSAELLRYRSREGRLVLAAAVLGSGMAFLDTTAVNVALPAIGGGLGADFAAFQWILNGYFLTLASFVLVAGAMGDVYGRRRIFAIGVVVFALASLPCGLAPTPTVLIAFRVLQGLGGAMLIPTSLAIVQTSFRPADRGRAIGTWAAFSSVWSLGGPLLGGWLIEVASWRAIFLINPALAAPVLWMALRYVPRSVRGVRRRPDLPGATAAVIALLGMIYALIEGPERGWGRPWVIGAALVGLLAGAAFPSIERRSANPMLPLGLFRRRAFAVANLVTFLQYGAMGAAFFLFTLQLQRVLGYSALAAGLATAPSTLMLVLVAPRAAWLVDRWGARRTLAAGLLLGAAGFALFAGIASGDSYLGGIMPGVILLGIGMGVTVPTVTAAALAALEDSHGGLAAGVNNAMARTAQLIGILVIPLGAGLSGIEQVGGVEFSIGFARAMVMTAVVLVAAAAIAILALREDGTG